MSTTRLALLLALAGVGCHRFAGITPCAADADCASGERCGPAAVCIGGEGEGEEGEEGEGEEGEGEEGEGEEGEGEEGEGEEGEGEFEDECLARLLDGSPLCTDFDGDGVDGIGAWCASGSDCDDTDPLVRPGAFEIPGDGVDNACGTDGDAPIDEGTGIFVAVDGDDLLGDGSRIAPFASIARAHVEVPAGGVLFLAAGTYDVVAPFTFLPPVVGGLERDTWSSGGGASTIRGSDPDENVLFSMSAFVQDVTFVPIERYFIGVVLAQDTRRVVVVPECSAQLDCDFGVFAIAGIHVALDCSAPDARLSAESADVTLIDSALGGIAHSGTSELRLLRSRVSGEVVAIGPLVAVSSVFDAAPEVQVITSQPGPIELYGSSVRARKTAAGIVEALRPLNGVVTVNSVLHAPRAVFVSADTRYSLLGTTILTDDGLDAATADACPAPECVQASGNVAALDGVGLPWFPLSITVPTSVVGDVNGACRDGPAPVPGALVEREDFGFEDDFDDDELDPLKWSRNVLTGTHDPNVPVTEIGGRLTIGPLLQDTPSSHFNAALSIETFDFSRGNASVQMVTPPAANTTATGFFAVVLDFDNHYRVFIEENVVSFEKKIAQAKITVGTVDFDEETAFWRIRHDPIADEISFETASDDTGVWTVRVAIPRELPISAVKLELKAGTDGVEANEPGTVAFDNFKAFIPSD